MNSRNKHTNRSEEVTLSLNADRGDASWQYERGERYGNSRKIRSEAKRKERRKERRKNDIQDEDWD